MQAAPHFHTQSYRAQPATCAINASLQGSYMMGAHTWVIGGLVAAAIQGCSGAAAHAPAHPRTELGFVGSGLGAAAPRLLRASVCSRHAVPAPALGLRAMSDEETAKAIKSMTTRSTSAYLNWMAPDLLPEDSDASAPKIEEKNEKKWKPESAVSVAESAKEDIKAKKAGKSAKSSKTKPKTSKKNAKALKKTVTRSPGRISSFGSMIKDAVQERFSRKDA